MGGTNVVYNYETFGISADGSVLAGYRNYGGAEEAIYWIGNQFQLIPFPASGTSAETLHVSDGGRCGYERLPPRGRSA